MSTFTASDFETAEGRDKAAQFLNGVQETLNDLIYVNQEALVATGKVYANRRT